MTRTPNELFDCDRVNSYLDSYLLDQVPPPERRGMRLHIHACSACFDKVAARDPLQLFAPLADQTPREEIWEGFWPAIDDGIRREETRRRARRVWAAAAAIVVAVAAGTAVLVTMPRLPPARPAVASGAAGAEPATPLPQTVEQVRTAGSREVQVYTMSYTQGPAPGTPVAELVLIVDKGLQL